MQYLATERRLLSGAAKSEALESRRARQSSQLAAHGETDPAELALKEPGLDPVPTADSVSLALLNHTR